jgi:hypothetical protein
LPSKLDLQKITMEELKEFKKIEDDEDEEAT